MTCILRTHNVTSPALRWLDSSVGRVLHRYRRGHGFESRSGLNTFSGFNFTTALKVVCLTAIIKHKFMTSLLCLITCRYTSTRKLEEVDFDLRMPAILLLNQKTVEMSMGFLVMLSFNRKMTANNTQFT